VARKPRPAPLSIRLPPDERAELEARAERAGLSIGGYFRSAVLDAPWPRVTRRPTVDHQLLARVLDAFRHSHIAGNINQLAKAANEGSWPDSRIIEQIRDDIRMIRNMLLRALGFTPPDDHGPTAGP
jgi:hypothetical protein